MNDQKVAQQIIFCLGGEDNIISLFHCITRLRFKLNDINRVDKNALQQIEEVMGLNLSGDQFQIIIGNKVSQICKAIKGEIPRLNSTNGIGDKTKQKKSVISSIFEIISGIFSPIIPAIAGAGILKGLLSLCLSFGWVVSSNQTFIILTAISDGVFYFMPMLLAFSAANKFGSNPYLSVALASVLFYPQLLTLFEKKEDISFLWLPVSPVSYASSVIPIILSVWLLSYVERLFNALVPNILRTMFVPLLSLLVVAPIMLIIIGPSGIFIGNNLSVGIVWLVDNMGVFAGLLIGGTLSLMIITGMHYVLVPIIVNNISRLGFDPFKILMYVANFGQAGAAFGVFLRSKNKKTKSLALSTSFTALMGVSEPAMYGINIRFKRPFAAALIGGGIGGAVALGFSVKTYAYALSGLPGLPALIGPTFGWALVSMAISFIVATVFTVMLSFTEDDDKVASNETNQSPIAPVPPDHSFNAKLTTLHEDIYAPIEGGLIPLNQLSDPVFADEVFGKGIAILPISGQVLSPLQGEIKSIFPTNHAIILKSNCGAEILIHIGIDTVKLNGRHFTSHIKEGQKINIGDPLITFDLPALQKEKIDPSVIIIIMNTEAYKDIQIISNDKIQTKDICFKLTLAMEKGE